MPPDLDIFVLTKQRNRPTIDRFLDAFIDRSANERRGDEELSMVPLIPVNNTIHWDRREWEPALTLSHVIERGLDYPRRAFVVHLTPKDKTIEQVWLGFTTDDQLLLGVSVEDTTDLPKIEQRARELLTQIAQQSEASLGMIAEKNPPILSQAEFEQQERSPFTIYFWRRAQ